MLLSPDTTNALLARADVRAVSNGRDHVTITTVYGIEYTIEYARRGAYQVTTRDTILGTVPCGAYRSMERALVAVCDDMDYADGVRGGVR